MQSCKYLSTHSNNGSMKTFDFNNFLAKNNIHVFTLDDAARILAKDKHYSAIFLARDKWVKKGH